MEPFTFADAEMLIGKAIRFKSGDVGIITSIEKDTELIYNGEYAFNFSELLDGCTFLDGTPFGKEKKWEPEIPEIGEWAFFWRGSNKTGIYGKLESINRNGRFVIKDVLGEWPNCSKTPPPHLGGK